MKGKVKPKKEIAGKKVEVEKTKWKYRPGTLALLEIKKVPKEYGIADQEVTFYVIGTRSGTTVPAWTEVPGNCYNGFTGSQ